MTLDFYNNELLAKKKLFSSAIAKISTSSIEGLYVITNALDRYSYLEEFDTFKELTINRILVLGNESMTDRELVYYESLLTFGVDRNNKNKDADLITVHGEVMIGDRTLEELGEVVLEDYYKDF